MDSKRLDSLSSIIKKISSLNINVNDTISDLVHIKCCNFLILKIVYKSTLSKIHVYDLTTRKALRQYILNHLSDQIIPLQAGLLLLVTRGKFCIVKPINGNISKIREISASIAIPRLYEPVKNILVHISAGILHLWDLHHEGNVLGFKTFLFKEQRECRCIVRFDEYRFGLEVIITLTFMRLME